MHRAVYGAVYWILGLLLAILLFALLGGAPPCFGSARMGI